MKMFVVSFLILLCVAGAQAGSETLSDLMAGKTKTDQTITLEVTVDATPREVYDYWVTPDKITKFFAPAAIIEPVPGGAFAMLFDPENDPRGENTGSGGARILRLSPGKELAFEWTTFLMKDVGKGGPPADPEERMKRPLPTWVELQFEPLGANSTRIRFAHYGFKTGGQWEESFAYFQRAWASVLLNLQTEIAKSKLQKSS